MRITTQMLNESARQAGLPINRSTLLDYIKNDGATNPLLETMNRNKENVANTAKKSNYEKLDKEADQLFGKDSDFVNKVEFLSTRISDNAEANVESLSIAYSAGGNLYSAMNSSKYDFWG